MVEAPLPSAAGLFRRVALITLSLGAVLGMALWALSQSPVGAQAIEELLSQARPELLIAAMLAMSGGFVAMALRWRSLLPPHNRATVPGLTAMILAGLMVNYALPGPVGELAAAWFAARRYALPLPVTLAAGGGARLMGLQTAALLACLAWPLLPPDLSLSLPGADGPVALGPPLGLGTALLALGCAHLTAAIASPRPMEALLRRAPARGALQAPLQSLAAAAAGLRSTGLRGILGAALWSVAAHSVVICGVLLAGQALGAELELAGALFTYCASTAGVILLFALPGSQLVWDGLFAALLVITTSASPAQAGAVALVVRVQQTLCMLLGSVSAAWLTQMTRAIKEESS
jgi:hypothetical protein